MATYNVEFGGQTVEIQVGENTGAAIDAAAQAAASAEAAAGSASVAAAQIPLVEAAGAAQVALATEQATISLTANLIPLELSNYLLARVEQATLVRAALPLGELYEAWGDSTVAGVGAPVGFSFVDQFSARVAQTKTAFTASSSGSTLTVSAVASGTLEVGDYLNAPGILPGTRITALGTGTGGTGTYVIFPLQTLTSRAFTGSFSLINNGVGGSTSTQTLATITAASAAKKGRHFVISTGLNDLDTGVGNRRDWSFAGFTKDNIVSMKAQQTGGKQAALVLAMRTNVALPGMKDAADFTHHYRDMVATFGADAIDVSRYKIFKTDRNGADLWNVTFRRGYGLSKLGQATNAIAVNNAPFVTNAGAFTDLSFDDGQMGWNSTNLRWERKVGASGAGSWIVADVKHPSRWGHADDAEILADWAGALTGTGAPFAPPQEFRCAFDVTARALIGQVAIRTSTSPNGAADRIEIVSGNDDFVFDIDRFGRIRRSLRGSLKRQVYQLVIKLSNNAGQYTIGLVDIYVGRASTQTLPQRLLIPSPVSLCGMEGNALSNAGKVYSGAAWINVSNGSTAPFLLNWQRGAAGSFAAMFLRLNWDASSSTNRLALSITSDANTNILTANSRTQQFGGQGVPQNTWGWLTWAVDLATGTVIAYWNDNAFSFTGTGATLTFTDTTIPLGNMSPGPFLNGRALNGADQTGSSPFLGGCGYFAVWDAFIDWTDSARRRELFNVDGTAAITNTTGTINGVASKVVAVQGEPVDLAWGGFNANQLVQINWDALRTMSIVT